MTDSIRRSVAVPPSPPSADALRALSPAERERRLAELAADGNAEGLLATLTETDAVSLRATLETSARRGSLGDVVRAAGLDALLQLGRARGLDVNDILASTDTVRERGLTAREARLIQENFGGTLDPDTIRLVFTKGAQTMGAGALSLGNTIHLDSSDVRLRLQPGTTRPASPEDHGRNSFNTLVFAHEAAHVWSYQHQGTAYAFNSVSAQLAGITSGQSRNAAYAYQPGRDFFSYGEEQRAALVQDYVAALRAKQRGQATSATTWGGTLPVDDVLKALEPAIRQMRAVGPGVAEPGGRTGLGVTQDGLADYAARNLDGAVAGLGAVTRQALVEGVTKAHPGQVLVGAVGVAAAGVASVMTREQNNGPTGGGGSAILDQVGLPRGVDVQTSDGVRLGVKAAWDAGAPTQEAPTLAISRPRVEWNAGADVPLGEATTLSADARATVGLDGRVQDAGAELRLQHPDVQARASVAAVLSDAPLRVDAHLDVTSHPVSLTADADLTLDDGRLQRAALAARVDAGPVSAGAEATLQRTADGLALESAAADASVRLRPGVTVGARASATAQGLEAAAATLGLRDDAGAMTLEARVSELMTKPTVGLGVTAAPAHAPVAVTANASVTPATGDTSVSVGIKGKF